MNTRHVIARALLVAAFGLAPAANAQVLGGSVGAGVNGSLGGPANIGAAGRGSIGVSANAALDSGDAVAGATRRGVENAGRARRVAETRADATANTTRSAAARAAVKTGAAASTAVAATSTAVDGAARMAASTNAAESATIALAQTSVEQGGTQREPSPPATVDIAGDAAASQEAAIDMSDASVPFASTADESRPQRERAPRRTDQGVQP